MRRTHKMVERARHNLSNIDDSRCGSHVPATHLGLNVTKAKALSLLVGGPSMAQPKAGADQTTADEGRSIMGTVASAEKDEQVTPYVKVFKDGYALTGCHRDSMYDFGDKYGDNKD